MNGSRGLLTWNVRHPENTCTFEEGELAACVLSFLESSQKNYYSGRLSGFRELSNLPNSSIV